MKFELGQKVKYKKISKKIKINMQYFDVPDFEEEEEKELMRREFIELKKERTGYVMGRRKLVFLTIFSVNHDHDNWEEGDRGFVDIARQKYRFAYLVAYGMGQTNYVIEEDLKEINQGEIMEKVYKWWDHLTEDKQFKIMLDHFPEQVKEDTDIDKMFGDMPDDDQLFIYNFYNLPDA